MAQQRPALRPALPARRSRRSPARRGRRDRRDQGRGQPADRGEHDPVLHAGAARRPVRPRPDRPQPEERSTRPACSRTSTCTARATPSSCTWSENPIVNRIAFEGNHKLNDEQLRAAAAAAAALGVHAAAGAGRPAAHPRRLRQGGPIRRDGGAEDHPSRPEPGRRGVRDQRRRDHAGQPHRVRRQPRLQREPAARGDRQPRGGDLALPVDQRRIRSRSGSISTRSCCAGST